VVAATPMVQLVTGALFVENFVAAMILATLTAAVLDETGGGFIEVSRQGAADRPRELGRAAGLELLDKGAAEMIARTRPDEY
jgi:porphobilinogen deaminase